MQNKISFYIILIVEILAVVLASIGIVEREAVLIMTGIMVFYFIFSRIEDSLILFILSIPLFVALPITDGFDTMANWRILLVILFLCLFFKQGLSIKVIKDKLGRFRIKEKFKHCLMEYLVVLFLGIGVLSLFVATDIIVGIKKILFLVNIFLLYIIIRNVIYKNKEVIPRIIKAGAVALIICLIVGYVQIISTIITPLYTFWQWWARNVISVFYGANLTKLLAVTNTWFSYYPDSPPTLRMFSVFPDSHSFAMFVIIGLIFLTYIQITKPLSGFRARSGHGGPMKIGPSEGETLSETRWGSRGKRRVSVIWVVIVLSFLALISSGSRGVWLSAIFPFLAAIFLLIFKKQKIFKPFLIMLIIFALSFPVSSLILSKSRQDGKDATLAFKRAKSITDLEELSVKSRIGIWKASFQSILKHPILGVGIGNYPVVLDEDISAAKKGASAHNLYLDVASEMGLLGLIALLLIFLEILKKSLKQLQQLEHYNLIFAFFFVWILIYNLFDVVLLNDKVLLLFMVALGIIYSIENYEKSVSIS